MGTATAGTVASVIKFLKKQSLNGGAQENLSTSKFARKEQAIGQPAIVAFLKEGNVPGFNDGVVQQELSQPSAFTFCIRHGLRLDLQRRR